MCIRAFSAHYANTIHSFWKPLTVDSFFPFLIVTFLIFSFFRSQLFSICNMYPQNLCFEICYAKFGFWCGFSGRVGLPNDLDQSAGQAVSVSGSSKTQITNSIAAQGCRVYSWLGYSYWPSNVSSATQSVRSSVSSCQPVTRRSGTTSPRPRGATLRCGRSRQRYAMPHVHPFTVYAANSAEALFISFEI